MSLINTEEFKKIRKQKLKEQGKKKELKKSIKEQISCPKCKGYNIKNNKYRIVNALFILAISFGLTSILINPFHILTIISLIFWVLLIISYIGIKVSKNQTNQGFTCLNCKYIFKLKN